MKIPTLFRLSFALLLTSLGIQASTAGTILRFNTTITVDTVSDPTPTDRSSGCDDFAGPNECSLRRAFNQARGLSAAERPVQIVFDLPAGDENAAVPGTWTINLASNQPIYAPAGDKVITTDSAIDTPDAELVIDGATQPGGRSSGGPPVFINMDTPFSSDRKQIEIRNLGFYGGVGIQVRPLAQSGQGVNRNDTQVTIENIWWGLSEDGTEIQYDGGDLAGQNGFEFNNVDGNELRNSVITGARGVAIMVTSGADDNVIEDNFIGTAADGTVPEPPPGTECFASGSFFSSRWYGGGGIQVGTSRGNIVRNNLIAGLDTVRVGTETVPQAIDIGVTSDTLVDSNVIGIDSAMQLRGVCGGAIFESTTLSANADEPNVIQDNVIARSRIQFPETPESDAAIFLSGNRTVGAIVVNNIVMDAAEDIIGFASSIPDAWENFLSARVLVIDGTTVLGTNGDESPCAQCELEIFLDDDAPSDGKAEALERLATTTSDADGNWSVQLPQVLQPGEAIRVITRSAAFNQIPGMTAGTTAMESRAYPYDFVFESTFSLTDSVD